MPTTIITQAMLRERFVYDPETGVFTNRVDSQRARKGVESCQITQAGYVMLYVNYSNIFAHRAVFLYLYNKIPFEVDHINHIKSDNRLLNLRELDRHIENSKNQRHRKNNNSGVMGVCFDKSRGKWIAKIEVHYKTINLGRFSDISDAIAARKAAELQYGFHPNHGAPLPVEP